MGVARQVHVSLGLLQPYTKRRGGVSDRGPSRGESQSDDASQEFVVVAIEVTAVVDLERLAVFGEQLAEIMKVDAGLL
jgi:hypothetical protein